MTRVNFTLNGRSIAADVEPRIHLADFIREHLRLTGTHLACEQGACGACTVTIDGEIARSCTTFAVACEGADVRTIEGFEDDPLMSALRAAFTAEHGLQCGFCTPGMIITARDMIRRLGSVDNARIRVELSGNLCRCTGYAGIVRAIRRVMDELPADVQRLASPTPAPKPVLPPAPPPKPATAAPAPTTAAKPGGGARIAQSFMLPQAPDVVWAFFAELPRVAACLPGAELVNYTGGDKVQGRVTAKIGPISAAFEGDADVTRDEGRRSGVIRGKGRDSKSGSGATGEVEYTVRAEGAGTRVDVAISFALSGPLAQFGRSGLVRDFVARMIAVFAANMQATLSGATSGAEQREFHAASFAFAVLWDRIKSALARLFGRV